MTPSIKSQAIEITRSILVGILCAIVLACICGMLFTGCPEPIQAQTPIAQRSNVMTDSNGVVRAPANFFTTNNIITNRLVIVPGTNAFIATNGLVREISVTGMVTQADQHTATIGGSISSIDWSAGDLQSYQLTAHVLGSVPFTNVDPGKSIVLRLTSITGNWNMGWPASVRWTGTAVGVVTNNTDYLVMLTAESDSLQHATWLHEVSASGGGSTNQLSLISGPGISITTNGNDRTIESTMVDTDTRLDNTTATNAVNMGGNSVTNIPLTPTLASEAASKSFVETSRSVVRAGTGATVSTNTVGSTITYTVSANGGGGASGVALSDRFGRVVSSRDWAMKQTQPDGPAGPAYVQYYTTNGHWAAFTSHASQQHVTISSEIKCDQLATNLAALKVVWHTGLSTNDTIDFRLINAVNSANVYSNTLVPTATGIVQSVTFTNLPANVSTITNSTILLEADVLVTKLTPFPAFDVKYQ